MAEALRAAALDGVPHGFLTRRGGVSRGAMGGLQCGFGAGDDPAAVRRNRELAAGAVLPGASLVGLHQVHSPDVIVATAPWEDEARPRGDALVTDRTGLLLAVVTADCAPVLLADRAAGVVGAAHAGWRGAHDGVLENTVDAMVALGADRAAIAAAIGPCIMQASYEVDDGFRARFGEGEGAFFAPGRAGHWQFDLPGYVAARLERAGVARVESLGRDTYAEPELFYSFRRATHRGEPDYGRLISLVGMPA